MRRVLLRSKWLVLLCAVSALVVGALPAGAKVVGHENYEFSDTDSFDDCGFTIDVAVTGRGSIRFRTVDGEAFLVKDTFKIHEVFTTPGSDEFFTLDHNGVFNELSATHVEGTIYEFTAIEAGQPFVMRDSDGNIVARDRGVIIHTALFDTLGDGEPSADFIMPISDVVHGPHPGFEDDFPFCELAAELLGVEG